MNEKLHKLNMGFNEVLIRLAGTPRSAIDKAKKELEKTKEKMHNNSNEAAKKPPHVVKKSTTD